MSEFELKREDKGKKQSAGDKNAEKFQVWLDSKIPIDEETGNKIYYRDTWLKLVNPQTHRLSRVDISKQSGIGESALRQNPTIKALREELESDLIEEGILPELTESGKAEQDTPKKYDQGASKRAVDSKRLKDLEDENQRLKAELKRFEELKEVLAEMGMGVEL